MQQDDATVATVCNHNAAARMRFPLPALCRTTRPRRQEAHSSGAFVSRIGEEARTESLAAHPVGLALGAPHHPLHLVMPRFVMREGRMRKDDAGMRPAPVVENDVSVFVQRYPPTLCMCVCVCVCVCMRDAARLLRQSSASVNRSMRQRQVTGNHSYACDRQPQLCMR